MLRESERLSRFNIPKALALGAVFSAVIFRRPLHIAVSFPLISLGALSHFNSKSDMNLVQSALMQEIANKYDFSVFDFHDSKRSSIYKTLYSSIVQNSSCLINKNMA